MDVWCAKGVEGGGGGSAAASAPAGLTESTELRGAGGGMEEGGGASDARTGEFGVDGGREVGCDGG
jgi:hypothetical protein